MEKVAEAGRSNILFYSGRHNEPTPLSGSYSTSNPHSSMFRTWANPSLVTQTQPINAPSLEQGPQGTLRRVETKTERIIGIDGKGAKPPTAVAKPWTTTKEGSPVPRSNKYVAKTTQGGKRRLSHQKLGSPPPSQLLCYYWVMYGACDDVDGQCSDFHPAEENTDVEPQGQSASAMSLTY